MEKKKKAEAGLDSLPPLGYVKGTLLWKKKFLFTHGWSNAGNSTIKRCGFSARVNAMITEFFMFLYHQADYLQIKNLANLWQTRMGKAMIPLNTHIAICLNIEIRR
jgi:oligoribonuclease (3'-5' exoribonuclease)